MHLLGAILKPPPPAVVVYSIGSFIGRWEKTFIADSEPYRFSIMANGGIRLWVNDSLELDDWILETV